MNTATQQRPTFAQLLFESDISSPEAIERGAKLHPRQEHEEIIGTMNNEQIRLFHLWAMMGEECQRLTNEMEEMISNEQKLKEKGGTFPKEVAELDAKINEVETFGNWLQDAFWANLCISFCDPAKPETFEELHIREGYIVTRPKKVCKEQTGPTPLCACCPCGH